MNKFLRVFLCVSLLAAPCLGAGTAMVVAETDTVEETVVSTIPTLDSESTRSQTDDSESIPEMEPEPSNDKLEDVPEPEAANESEEEEEKLETQSTTNDASPYAITLIEGVDIDAEFAKVIRTTPGTAQNGWSGYGKGQDQLTDKDMEALTGLYLNQKNLTSLKGIEYAINLDYLNCSHNNLTSLDLSNNPLLTQLDCSYNSLTVLDVSNQPLLAYLRCMVNQITDLNVSTASLLTDLICSDNPLTSLDVSNNPLLTTLICVSSQLSSLDVSSNPKLDRLNCSYNPLTNLDISANLLLEELYCSETKNYGVGWTGLGFVDTSKNASLRVFYCSNSVWEMDVSENSLLEELDCSYNSLLDIDVTNNPALKILVADRNILSDLDITNNPVLERLSISYNFFTNLDFLSTNAPPLLQQLICDYNQIYDITGAIGLTNLVYFSARSQSLESDIPLITGGNATVDLLKTTASKGLSATNIDIGGSPVLTPNGDKINLSNVTYADLNNKSIAFSYDPGELAEQCVVFSGTILFAPVSNLENQFILNQNENKIESGSVVTWKWTISSINPLKAEDVHATLTLPTGLIIDPGSIKRNGAPATLSDIDGTNSLGDLSQGESITFEFKTTATGSANDWLKATGRLDWVDPNARTNQADGSVQIKDDEQTHTPKTQEDMALLSVPESFRFGLWDVKNTTQTFSLHSSNYLTNTEVVSKGFYTRLRDDRAVNSGWKLSAQLSDFKDSTSEVMPNSAGTSLRLQDMSIESVVDRDTPAEAIDPTPIGVPSTVLADETLVAGQTAKPLVTAGTGEGTETWQLRIPFDKVFLNLPANAGKKDTHYSATLTWSLDDTP